MDMKGVVKGIGTTSFVATRVVAIAAAGMIAVAIATSIKNRLTDGADETVGETTDEAQ